MTSSSSEISSTAGNAWFLIDTLRMHDVVPNWRPLTGVVYLAEWRMFGLHPLAWRLVNLTIHLSSLVLLYALVVRVTKRPAIGATSALIFGISGAHFDTVTYITALPHVLAMFFVLASLWPWSPMPTTASATGGRTRCRSARSCSRFSPTKAHSSSRRWSCSPTPYIRGAGGRRPCGWCCARFPSPLWRSAG